MYYTIKNTQHLTKIFLFGLGLTLAACGGGGGSSEPAAIAYTGKTTPADVDDTNTQSYSAAIIDGSQDSQENLGNFGITAISSDGTPVQNKQHAMIATLIQQVKSDVENNSLGNSTLILGATESFPGTCSGNAGTFTVTTSNETSTGADVAITYNNYCVGFTGNSVTISGSLTASIVFTGTGISSMNITVPHLSIIVIDSSGTYTNEFSGSVAVTFTTNGEIATLTVSMNFIENGKTYRLSGLSYTTSSANISIEGTIFHPDYGSVTFTTTEPFVLFNDQLCDGTLAVTGVSSNFTITANADCSSYTYTGTNNLGDAFGNSFLNL